MVRPGTRLTFEVQGTLGFTFQVFSVDGIRAAAIPLLSPYFEVHAVQMTDAGLFNAGYSARVIAEPRAAYGSIDDVKSIVRHAFWEATGNEPTVTVPEYGDPEQGALAPGPFDALGRGLQQSLTLALVGIVLVFYLVEKD